MTKGRKETIHRTNMCDVIKCLNSQQNKFLSLCEHVEKLGSREEVGWLTTKVEGLEAKVEGLENKIDELSGLLKAFLGVPQDQDSPLEAPAPQGQSGGEFSGAPLPEGETFPAGEQLQDPLSFPQGGDQGLGAFTYFQCVTIPIVTWTSEVRAWHVTLGHVHLRAVRAVWGRLSGDDQERPHCSTTVTRTNICQTYPPTRQAHHRPA